MDGQTAKVKAKILGYMMVHDFENLMLCLNLFSVTQITGYPGHV
jgi:hypothetical protein